MSQPQNAIAVIWDFDGTLIPGSMQDVILDYYGLSKDEKTQFWNEVNSLPDFYRPLGITVSREICHLNHLLTYAQQGVFKGLNNKLLRDLGQRLQFHPGLPEFFPELQKSIETDPAYRQWEIKLEHYIISSGIRQMIEGSRIAPHVVKRIWACEFIEVPAPPRYAPSLTLSVVPGKAAPRRGKKVAASPSLGEEPIIRQIGYFIDSRSKNNILFEINKGSNVYPEVDVNAAMPDEERRIPFKNMIYIADGPSDTSCFSVVKQLGGKRFAVYDSNSREQLRQAMMLQDVGRVNSIGPADYQRGEQAYLWIKETALQFAERIAREKREALAAKVVPPARHIVEVEAEQLREVSDVATASEGE